MKKHTVFLAVAASAMIAALPGEVAAQAAKTMAKGPGLAPACAAGAPAREFLVIAGEWDTVPKDKGGKPVAYNDRGHTRAANSKLERYNFDPSMIIVKRGECVTLRIHGLKGSHHNLSIEGTEIGSDGAPLVDDAGQPTGVKLVARSNPNSSFEGPEKLKAGEFVRGEQAMLRFQAKKPGTYRMICEVHTFIGPKGELRGYDDQGKPVQGPMVAYVTVLP